MAEAKEGKGCVKLNQNRGEFAVYQTLPQISACRRKLSGLLTPNGLPDAHNLYIFRRLIIVNMANHGPSFGLTAEVDAKRAGQLNKDDEVLILKWIGETLGEDIGSDLHTYDERIHFCISHALFRLHKCGKRPLFWALLRVRHLSGLTLPFSSSKPPFLSNLRNEQCWHLLMTV